MKLKHLQSLLESVRVFDSPDIEYEQYPTPPHLAAQIVQMMHSYGDVQGKAVGDLGVGCGILTIAAHLMGSAHNVGLDIDPAATAIALDNFARFELRADIVHVDVRSMRWNAEGDDNEAEREQAEDDAYSDRQPRRGGQKRDRGRQGRRGRARAGADSGRGRQPRHRPASRLRDSDDGRDGEKEEEEESRSNDDSGCNDEGEAAAPAPCCPPLSRPLSPARSPAVSVSSAPFPPCLLDTVVLNPPFGTRQSGMDVCFLHVALQLSRSAVYSLHKTSTRAFIAALCLQWGVKAEVVAEMQFELKRSYSWHRETARDVQVDLWRIAFWDERKRPERFTAGRARAAR